MKVKLKKPRKPFSDAVYLENCEPFIVNPRGLLIHRVAEVILFEQDGRPSHVSVHYLCGNLCHIEPAMFEDVVYADPPKNKLLCEFCEVRARATKEKTADQLAKRHVHCGRVRAFQTCCQSGPTN